MVKKVLLLVCLLVSFVGFNACGKSKIEVYEATSIRNGMNKDAEEIDTFEYYRITLNYETNKCILEYKKHGKAKVVDESLIIFKGDREFICENEDDYVLTEIFRLSKKEIEISSLFFSIKAKRID